MRRGIENCPFGRDKFSIQVGRLDVGERGRHRRWSEDENIKIVLESLQAPRQITATARRYGILRSLLLRWRRLFRAEKDATEQLIALTRASQKGPSADAPARVRVVTAFSVTARRIRLWWLGSTSRAMTSE
nr:transposase [Bradyrhizobium sp. Rc2d]